VHIPIGVSYFFGGVIGQATYHVFSENAILLPCFFTGGIGVLYLSLPFIQKATESVHKARMEAFKMGGRDMTTRVEVRVVGDPTKYGGTRTHTVPVPRKSIARTSSVGAGGGRVQELDVDLEIQQFSSEMEEDLGGRSSESSTGRRTSTGIYGGGGARMVLSIGTIGKGGMFGGSKVQTGESVEELLVAAPTDGQKK
jgi:hypothetical protein